MSKQKPKIYECIQAWDKMMGSNWDYSMRQIEQASKDKAPQDAIFYSQDRKRWTTLKEVTSGETRWFFKQNYPWLVKQYTDWELEQRDSSSK